jgi:hypothetical protein
MIKTILRAAFSPLFFGAPAHAQPVSPSSRFNKGWQTLITIQYKRKSGKRPVRAGERSCHQC